EHHAEHPLRLVDGQSVADDVKAELLLQGFTAAGDRRRCGADGLSRRATGTRRRRRPIRQRPQNECGKRQYCRHTKDQFRPHRGTLPQRWGAETEFYTVVLAGGMAAAAEVLLRGRALHLARAV